MKRLLEKFKREKKVVSIYNDSADTGNCWTGYVIENENIDSSFELNEALIMKCEGNRYGEN